MSDRRRILVLEGPGRSAGNLPQNCSGDSEVVRVDSLAQGLALLHAERFDGVFADTRDPAVSHWAANLLQSEHILEALPDGVAVIKASRSNSGAIGAILGKIMAKRRFERTSLPATVSIRDGSIDAHDQHTQAKHRPKQRRSAPTLHSSS